jgi:hypothetical protein
VGTGKTVSVSGITLSGPAAANYILTTTTATTTANTDKRMLTVTATASDKLYDDTPATTVMLADNRVASDSLTLSYTSAAFANRNAGNGKTVAVSGIPVGGTDAGNYSLASSRATTTANITARSLTTGVTSSDKVYDGTTAATLPWSAPRKLVQRIW